MRFNAYYYTNIGGRPKNEDNVSLLEVPGSVVAIVADGLGGLGYGDIASSTAIKVINSRLSGDGVTADNLVAAVNEANDWIIKQQTDGKKMKTTIAILYISDEGKAVAVHVGDTRIYQFSNNHVAFQTIDHSVSQMAVYAGEINTDEICGHCDRNRLTRALGISENVKVDVSEMDCRRGDSFLICTDGFWEAVTEGEMIKDIQRSADSEEWISKMRARIEKKQMSSGDNNSAIAINII